MPTLQNSALCVRRLELKLKASFARDMEFICLWKLTTTCPHDPGSRISRWIMTESRAGPWPASLETERREREQQLRVPGRLLPPSMSETVYRVHSGVHLYCVYTVQWPANSADYNSWESGSSQPTAAQIHSTYTRRQTSILRLWILQIVRNC